MLHDSWLLSGRSGSAERLAGPAGKQSSFQLPARQTEPPPTHPSRADTWTRPPGVPDATSNSYRPQHSSLPASGAQASSTGASSSSATEPSLSEESPSEAPASTLPSGRCADTASGTSRPWQRQRSAAASATAAWRTPGGAGVVCSRKRPEAAPVVVATGPSRPRRGSRCAEPMWMQGSGVSLPCTAAAVPSATMGPS